jgi:hypothetical protein
LPYIPSSYFIIIIGIIRYYGKIFFLVKRRQGAGLSQARAGQPHYEVLQKNADNASQNENTLFRPHGDSHLF